MRGRFRRYDSENIARLAFIRRARQLGFTLHEVRGLLRLAAAGGTEDARAEAHALAAAHLIEVRAKIVDLRSYRTRCADAMLARRPGCPIIEALSAG